MNNDYDDAVDVCCCCWSQFGGVNRWHFYCSIAGNRLKRYDRFIWRLPVKSLVKSTYVQTRQFPAQIVKKASMQVLKC